MLRESLPLSLELLSSALCAIVLVASRMAKDSYACAHHEGLSFRPLHAMLTQQLALLCSTYCALMIAATKFPELKALHGEEEPLRSTALGPTCVKLGTGDRHRESATAGG